MQSESSLVIKSNGGSIPVAVLDLEQTNLSYREKDLAVRESAWRCCEVSKGHAATTRASSGLNSIREQQWVQQSELPFPKSFPCKTLSKPARKILIRVSGVRIPPPLLLFLAAAMLPPYAAACHDYGESSRPITSSALGYSGHSLSAACACLRASS